MTVSWRKLYPNDYTMLSDLPTLHSDNFNIIQSAADIEHYAPTSAASGAHWAGKVGAIKFAPTSTLSALSPNAGALAWNTTIGALQYYTTGWVVASSAVWSNVRAYLNSTSPSVTANAAAQQLIFDSESYDTQNEYNNTTGILTVLASGYYLVNINVTFVASGSQDMSATYVPTSDVSASSSWKVSGSADHYANVDEASGSPTDTNCQVGKTLSAHDVLSAVMTAVPSGATDIELTLSLRLKGTGCVCNSTCYGYGTGCAAYVFVCISCYNSCYGYAAASCGTYTYCAKQGWVCSSSYSAATTCTCDSTAAYKSACSYCYGVTYGAASCECDSAAHGAPSAYDTLDVDAFLKIGGAYYYGGTNSTPDGTFTNYDTVWTTNPTAGTDWAAAATSAIQGFGYVIRDISADTHSPSAFVSQVYTVITWWPQQPKFQVHLYKAGAKFRTASVPLTEIASADTSQTVSLRAVVYCTAGTELSVYYEKSLLGDTVTAGTSLTNWSVSRLPGPLL